MTNEPSKKIKKSIADIKQGLSPIKHKLRERKRVPLSSSSTTARRHFQVRPMYSGRRCALLAARKARTQPTFMPASMRSALKRIVGCA